jgi:hypothetical protein
MKKLVHIISGGTISHIRPHLALCAPAYGTVGSSLFRLCCRSFGATRGYDIKGVITKMAGGNDLETNEDVSKYLDELITDPQTKVLFMPVALCDFEAFHIDDGPRYDGGLQIGKEYPRLNSSDGQRTFMVKPTEKLLGKIREKRKDIFLVAFKTTADATEDEMFKRGTDLLKKNSCNLVLVNDVKTRVNMIVTPEMARYSVTTNRKEALKELVTMAAARSNLTFHRTDLVKGLLVEWESDAIPPSFKTIVDYCIENGAYKEFNGVTVGHYGFFAAKDEIGGISVISSRRKVNYNNKHGRNMVEVRFNGERQVAATKPSAGVRSQLELFQAQSRYDCVVHFHCPMKPESIVNVRPQWGFECGSLECGQNTLSGVRQHDEIAAVMLDKHGPNILFHRDIDPKKVIKFIDDNFDLSRRTSE